MCVVNIDESVNSKQTQGQKLKHKEGEMTIPTNETKEYLNITKILQ